MSPVKRGIMLSVLIPLVLLLAAPGLRADSKELIDVGSRDALERLRADSPEASKLIDRAVAVLVFPDVVEMGFGVGGEYGEGSLLVGGEPRAYYVTAGGSLGLQLGAQTKSEVILFMTEEALRSFRGSSGWKVGVDGSVALFNLGADGAVDTATAQESVVGFIFSNAGLMYNLSLEGRKITRIAK